LLCPEMDDAEEQLAICGMDADKPDFDSFIVKL
jgi:hypothetical protein